MVDILDTRRSIVVWPFLNSALNIASHQLLTTAGQQLAAMPDIDHKTSLKGFCELPSINNRSSSQLYNCILLFVLWIPEISPLQCLVTF